MPGKVMVFVCEASHPAIINMTVNVTVVMVMMPDIRGPAVRGIYLCRGSRSNLAEGWNEGASPSWLEAAALLDSF